MTLPSLPSGSLCGAGTRRPPGVELPRFSLVTGLCASLLLAHPASAQLDGVGDAPEPGQRVVLVTGSTGGLGREVARSLAANGAHVIVHGRNRARAAALLEEIRAGGAGSARYYLADFGELSQVEALARSILRDYQRLDALVNNAGIALIGDPQRYLSDDGNELHFQVNYLAGFLLTDRLLPLLLESAPARIVNVASRGQAPVDFDDLRLDEDYSFGRAYGVSKLSQIMHMLELADSLDGTGVTALALHPSGVMDTDMIREAGLEPRSSVLTGRDAVLRLLDEPGLESGGYFSVFDPARAHPQAYDAEVRRRLMEVSRALVDAAIGGSPGSGGSAYGRPAEVATR